MFGVLTLNKVGVFQNIMRSKSYLFLFSYSTGMS